MKRRKFLKIIAALPFLAAIPSLFSSRLSARLLERLDNPYDRSWYPGKPTADFEWIGPEHPHWQGPPPVSRLEVRELAPHYQIPESIFRVIERDRRRPFLRVLRPDRRRLEFD